MITAAAAAAARLQVNKIQHMTTSIDDLTGIRSPAYGNRRQGVLNAGCCSFDFGLITKAKNKHDTNQQFLYVVGQRTYTTSATKRLT
jgi:hypothetical protein